MILWSTGKNIFVKYYYSFPEEYKKLDQQYPPYMVITSIIFTIWIILVIPVLNLFCIMIAFFLIYSLYLTLLGIPGLLFGNISKALLNRQREYLADAYAVQFTRNPLALANALKKIGAFGSKINSKYASEFNHLCFSTSTDSLFISVHPSLKKRIKKLDPSWDGKFIVSENLNTKTQTTLKTPKQNEDVIKTITTIAILNEIDNIGNPNDKSIQKADEILSSISENIKKYIYDETKAQFIIYSILLDKEQSNEQIEILCDNNRENIVIFKEIYEHILSISEDKYLVLIQLCISTLKNMSIDEYLIFKKNIENLIAIDNHVSMLEWCLKYLVLYPLDINFGIKSFPNEKYNSIHQIKLECSSILSYVAFMQTKDDKRAKSLFDNYKKDRLKILTYIENDIISTFSLKDSLDTIQSSSANIRKNILEMIVLILSEDKKINKINNLIIHAFAQALHLPLGL
jgi:hypothetical protein